MRVWALSWFDTLEGNTMKSFVPEMEKSFLLKPNPNKTTPLHIFLSLLLINYNSQKQPPLSSFLPILFSFLTHLFWSVYPHFNPKKGLLMSQWVESVVTSRCRTGNPSYMVLLPSSAPCVGAPSISSGCLLHEEPRFSLPSALTLQSQSVAGKKNLKKQDKIVW